MIIATDGHLGHLGHLWAKNSQRLLREKIDNDNKNMGNTAMVVSSAQCTFITARAYRIISFPRIRIPAILILLMSKAGNSNTNSKSPENRTPHEIFSDYLDGYLFGTDLYPICYKHLFAKNDAYALLKDFGAVGAALSKATQLYISSPHSDSATIEDVRRRRVETARRAIESLLKTQHSDGGDR